MAERGLRLRLGLFVAGALAVLAGLVVFFGRAPELFSNKATYSVLFPEAPGLSPGVPVRKSGIRIGDVESLDLDPDSGRVRVRIRVDRKYLPRTSEDASITKGLLSGDAAVDFVPRAGEDGRPVPRGDEWPPGSDIPGLPPITPRSLLTPASGVLANAQQSLERVAKAFETLEKLQTVQPKLERALDEASETFRAVRGLVPAANKTLERIQNFLGTDAPAENPGGVVPAGLAAAQPPDAGNARALVRDLQDLARAARPAVEDIRAAVRRLEPEVAGTLRSARQSFDSVNEVLSPENRKQIAELIRNVNGVAVSIVRIANALGDLLAGAEKSLKNLDAVLTNANAVVADVRAVTMPLAAKGEAIVASVTDSAEQLNKALVEVRGLLGTFGRGNGSVQKLLTDPTVYQNLDEAAGSLARVLARAEKITRDFEVFADKVARRPELIGVGGALRPSSGLKDLPGAPLPAYRPDWPPALPARPDPPPVQGYPPR
ncbi:MAG: hypothetical protein C0501_13205 [Isosphaera sp.]|nr:hypothetical protein [Isosphaera sp.]